MESVKFFCEICYFILFYFIFLHGSALRKKISLARCARARKQRAVMYNKAFHLKWLGVVSCLVPTPFVRGLAINNDQFALNKTSNGTANKIQFLFRWFKGIHKTSFFCFCFYFSTNSIMFTYLLYLYFTNERPSSYDVSFRLLPACWSYR